MSRLKRLFISIDIFFGMLLVCAGIVVIRSGLLTFIYLKGNEKYVAGSVLVLAGMYILFLNVMEVVKNKKIERIAKTKNKNQKRKGVKS